jgi:hypothetical protein
MLLNYLTYNHMYGTYFRFRELLDCHWWCSCQRMQCFQYVSFVGVRICY